MLCLPQLVTQRYHQEVGRRILEFSYHIISSRNEAMHSVTTHWMPWPLGPKCCTAQRSGVNPGSPQTDEALSFWKQFTAFLASIDTKSFIVQIQQNWPVSEDHSYNSCSDATIRHSSIRVCQALTQVRVSLSDGAQPSAPRFRGRLCWTKGKPREWFGL